MDLGLKPLGKSNHGPRTQTSRETHHLEEAILVLDRTKALSGPRIQATGETNYFEETIRVLG